MRLKCPGLDPQVPRPLPGSAALCPPPAHSLQPSSIQLCSHLEQRPTNHTAARGPRSRRPNPASDSLLRHYPLQGGYMVTTCKRHTGTEFSSGFQTGRLGGHSGKKSTTQTICHHHPWPVGHSASACPGSCPPRQTRVRSPLLPSHPPCGSAFPPEKWV